MNISTIKLPTFYAEGQGALSVIEEFKEIPFSIKRIYYIHQVPKGIKRGGHAHKRLQQFLFCPYGEIEVILDDGVEKKNILLNSPSDGIILTSGLWRDMLWKKDNSILCVAASECYDESDYIRDYEMFLEFTRNTKLGRKEN